MKKSVPVVGGRHYGELPNGRLVEVPPMPADIVVCRRVADFPASRPPAGATIAPCPKCGAPIAFNPRGLYLDRPRVCMQCYGIKPDPIV